MRALHIFFFLFVSFALPRLASSAVTPDSAAREIISEMQRANTVLVVLDHVNWQTAFSELSLADRNKLGVKTPIELRERYRKLISDPVSHMRTNLQDKMGGTSAQGLVAPVIETMSQGFGASVQQIKKRIVAANYKVAPARVSGARAFVPITVQSGSEVRKETVEFIKVGKRWQISSLRSLDKAGYLKDVLSGNLLERFDLPL